MIPGVDLVTLISIVGILGVMFIVFAESGLLIGFFLPGDSLLFTTGFLINAGIIDINIHLAVFLVFIAAVLGDTVGYLFGRKAGPRLFRRPDARLFKQAYIQRAQDFYDKNGGKTIILARFIPIVRTFAPVVAGAAHMKYKTFLTYNLIGGLLWAAGVTYAGFFIGKWLHSMGVEIDAILLPIVAGIIIISVLPAAIHILKEKSSRDALWNGTKREISSIFRRK